MQPTSSAVESGVATEHTAAGAEIATGTFPHHTTKRSRYDGQVEDADDKGPTRPLIPVTAQELNGHLKREQESSTAASRLLLHPYKQLPLTGAIQSMMPMFRRSDSFGRIRIPDEFGYYPEAATEHFEKRAATEYSENDG